MPERLSLKKPSAPEELPISGPQSIDQGNTPPKRHEYLLNNEAIELTKPLYEDGEVPDKLAHIEGKIMGVIGLQAGEDEDGLAILKMIAIVDYGQDFNDKDNPKKYFREAPGLGGPQSRWEMRGINYTPEDHLMPHCAIEGQAVIGRNYENPGNQQLGLTEPGNEMISKDHLTVEVDGAGKAVITDHSTNGTKVTKRG